MPRPSTTTLVFLTATFLLCGYGAVAMGASIAPPPGIPQPPSTSQLARERVASHVAARGRTSAWQRAMDEANRPHPADFLRPRMVAGLVGSVWFLLAARAQWRSRRRRTRA